MSESPEMLNSDEYEEICSEEVDRVVETLDRLIEGVQSENVKHLLEEAASSIYFLVYEEEEVNAEGAADDESDDSMDIAA